MRSAPVRTVRLGAAFSVGSRELLLRDLELPLDLDSLLGGRGDWEGDWEVELGFGKGRYLLQESLAHPERRYLGIELVSKYYRLLQRRARSHGAENLVVVRGEALYLLASVLPRAFARAVHVYFPDPWPKARHHKRRLFDPETVDLVLGLLRPGGALYFATDFIEYGEVVVEILQSFPGLRVDLHPAPWPDGARTNYEAKYIEEGRPILRLTARWEDGEGPRDPLHPAGRVGIVAAPTGVPKELGENDPSRPR